MGTRRHAYRLHALLAYQVGVFLVLLGVTGSLAAMREELGPFLDAHLPSHLAPALGCEDGADLLRQLHVRLLAGRAGRVFVGMLGLFSTLFLLAGSRVAARTRPRRRTSHRRHGVHRRLGRASAPLLVAFALSGFLLGLEPIVPEWLLGTRLYGFVESFHTASFAEAAGWRAPIVATYVWVGALPLALLLATIPMLRRRSRRQSPARASAPRPVGRELPSASASAPRD
ncbi:MAG: PepSY domain-containing protein [Polyangiales bacterium]